MKINKLLLLVVTLETFLGCKAFDVPFLGGINDKSLPSKSTVVLTVSLGSAGFCGYHSKKAYASLKDKNWNSMQEVIAYSSATFIFLSAAAIAAGYKILS